MGLITGNKRTEDSSLFTKEFADLPEIRHEVNLTLMKFLILPDQLFGDFVAAYTKPDERRLATKWLKERSFEFEKAALQVPEFRDYLLNHSRAEFKAYLSELKEFVTMGKHKLLTDTTVKLIEERYEQLKLAAEKINETSLKKELKKEPEIKEVTAASSTLYIQTHIPQSTSPSLESTELKRTISEPSVLEKKVHAPIPDNKTEDLSKRAIFELNILTEIRNQFEESLKQMDEKSPAYVPINILKKYFDTNIKDKAAGNIIDINDITQTVDQTLDYLGLSKYKNIRETSSMKAAFRVIGKCNDILNKLTEDKVTTPHRSL